VVVASVVEAVLAGRAAVSAPTGAALGPERFVDVRYLAVQAQDRPLRDAGPRPRRWLFAHAPSEVALEVDVPAGAYLQAALALDPAVWAAPTGDGVRFLAALRPLGATGTARAPAGALPAEASGAAVLLDAVVDPRAQGEQRRWVEVLADLGPWAGQRVRLSLRTEGRADPTYDWAGWGEPAIVRLDPLTADRLLGSAAAIHRLALRP
jgi:hypothetical protein